MSTKKKLIISLSALCLVLIVAVVAIVAVYAAGTQTVTSNIKVTYTAMEVDGTVSATYTLKNGTATNMTTNGASDGDTTITFAAADGKTTKSLTPQGDIELSSTADYVIFQYTFTNSGSRAYTAVLTYTDDGNDDTNATIVYASDNTESTTWAESPSTLTVASGSNGTSYYAKVSIDNLALDASFSGYFTWTLTAIAD